MLETLGLRDEARAVDQAIASAVRDRACTADGGGTLGTREAGEEIRKRIRSVHRFMGFMGFMGFEGSAFRSLFWLATLEAC